MEKKIKILVVDDHEPTRGMYAEVFRNAGFEVLEAKDGVEGLDIATKELPDVVFTGIIMPRMDGFGLIEALKKSVATASIPVVVSSHLGREEDKRRANTLGAREFIVRDYTTPNQVIDKVKALFLGGGSYNVTFDQNGLDAPRIARDLNLSSNFQCMECDQKMIINLKLKDPKEKVFEARFVCPNCGWEAR